MNINQLATLLRNGGTLRQTDTLEQPDGTRRTVIQELVIPGRPAPTPSLPVRAAYNTATNWQPTGAQLSWYRALYNGGCTPYTESERELYYRIQDWDRDQVEFTCPAPCIPSRRHVR